MANLFLNRRQLLSRTAGAAALAGLAPGLLRAQGAAIPVAAAYTVPVEQKWVGRIHIAAEAAQARGDISYKFSENVSNTDYTRVLREYAEGGAKMVIGEAFAVEQEAREVAADYPEIAFLMGSSFKADPDLPNFSTFDNYIQDASYLSGIIAGAMSKSGNIGMVGGFPIPEVNRLMNAFMAGAKEVNPDLKFQIAFIGSWFDPPKAKETAFAMIENGADLLYAERFGVADAAKERGILSIGNVVNTQADYPETEVASALWHFEPTMDAATAAVAAGEFTAADYGVFSFMKHGGCSLSELGTFEGKVPAETMELVAARTAQILSGEFEVEIVDSEPAA